MTIKIEQSAYFEGRRVSESDIGGLMNALEGIGIKIDPNDCEKNISYTYLRRSRDSIVPLLLDLGNHARVTKYILRNEQLEVQLRDHSQIVGSGIPGMIGSRIGSSGVLCEIKFEGHSGGEGTVRDTLSALRSFYELPREI